MPKGGGIQFQSGNPKSNKAQEGEKLDRKWQSGIELPQIGVQQNRITGEYVNELRG